MKLHNVKKRMKKISLIFIFLFVTVFCASADTVIENECFYEPWIIGSWDCIFSVSYNEESETSYAHADISGCETNSEVCFVDESGEDYLTLEELVQEILSVFGLSASGNFEDELDAMKKELSPEEEAALNIKGDTKLRLNEEKNLLYMNFSISIEGDNFAMNFRMEKTNPENKEDEAI